MPALNPDQDLIISKLDTEAAIVTASNGASLKEICRVLGCTVFSLHTLLNRYPTFAAQLKQAREIGFTVRAEGLRDLVHNDPFADPNRMKVIVDTEKWLLSKLHPRVFGDRIDVNITEKVDVSEPMKQARERARRVIDITPKNVAINQAVKALGYDPFAE